MLLDRDAMRRALSDFTIVFRELQLTAIMSRLNRADFSWRIMTAYFYNTHGANVL